MKFKCRSLFFYSSLNIFLAFNFTQACDLHPIYTAINSNNLTDNRTDIGIMHQFTHYESNVKPLGQDYLPGQHLESNIAQIFADYRINHRLSTQLNLPLIHRDFRRLNDGHVESSSESGLGDLSFLLKFRAFDLKRSNSFTRIELLGGLKLPTGNSDRLGELNEEAPNHKLALDHASLRHGSLRHGATNGSLIGGEDLALGSGSYDWISGVNFFYRQANWFFLSGLQYTLRQEGDHNYHYGNDLQWHAGPGVYFSQNQDRDIAMRIRLAADSKLKDRLNSESINNTDQSRVFLGPEIRYESKDGWSFIVASNFAIKTESASDGVVPQYSILSVFSIDI